MSDDDIIITDKFDVWLNATSIDDEVIRESLIEGLQRSCSAAGFNIVQQGDHLLVAAYGSKITLILKSDQDRIRFIRFVEQIELNEEDEDGFRRNVDGHNT